MLLQQAVGYRDIVAFSLLILVLIVRAASPGPPEIRKV